MARQQITLGTVDNDGTGNTLKQGGAKINGNFSELYAALGADLNWLAPVRVAATANVDIATALEAGDTVDAVVLVAGDRVLLPAQTAAAQNGIYVVPATGAAARAADADAGAELAQAIVYVQEGTSAGRLMRCDNVEPIVVDTDALTFTEYTVQAGAGAGGGFELLATPVYNPVAAASVDVVLDAGYFHHRIYFSLVPGTDNQNLNAHVTEDNFATVKSGAAHYARTIPTITSSGISAAGGSEGAPDIVLAGSVGNVGDESAVGYIDIFNAADAAKVTTMQWEIVIQNASGNIIQYNGAARYKTASIVNGLRLSFATGTLTGTVRSRGIAS